MPTQEHDFADPQDGQVGDPVAVEIKWIRAIHPGQVGGGRGNPLEAQRSADRGPITVERGRPFAASEIEVGKMIAVAIEDGDAAADLVEIRAVEALGDA